MPLEYIYIYIYTVYIYIYIYIYIYRYIGPSVAACGHSTQQQRSVQVGLRRCISIDQIVTSGKQSQKKRSKHRIEMSTSPSEGQSFLPSFKGAPGRLFALPTLMTKSWEQARVILGPGSSLM